MSVRPTQIAIVDDDEAVVKALRRLLVAEGYAVTTFTDGAAFITARSTIQPECLVLDLHMLQIDGFAVLAALAADPVRLPVVVITGHDSPATRQRVKAAGASAYLRKPIDDRQLLSAIQEALAAP